MTFKYLDREEVVKQYQTALRQIELQAFNAYINSVVDPPERSKHLAIHTERLEAIRRLEVDFAHCLDQFSPQGQEGQSDV